jgi:hypothetical protein
MKLGKFLGYINSRILLTLIFWLIVFPLASLSRLFLRNNKYQAFNNKSSTWVDSKHRKSDLESLQNPF